MKRIVLFVLMLVSVAAISQPANYLNIRSRYNLIAVKTDSGFHVPGYSTIPNYRGGVWTGSGNVGVDTVNNKFYFYSGGAWREAGSTNYADSLRRSGLAVQMQKNGNWTTQFNLPDSLKQLIVGNIGGYGESVYGATINDDTLYMQLVSTESPGLVPAYTGDSTDVFRGNGTWGASTGGATPAGNYGNIQLNRNGELATPASDSLTYNGGELRINTTDNGAYALQVAGNGYFKGASANIVLEPNAGTNAYIQMKDQAGGISYLSADLGLSYIVSSGSYSHNFYTHGILGLQIKNIAGTSTGGTIETSTSQISSSYTGSVGADKGAYHLERTIDAGGTGPAHHGYVSKTTFRTGAAAFNDFYAQSVIGRSDVNQDHWAGFQTRITKDSANTVSNLYDFVALGSLINAGTATNRYGYYMFDANNSGGGTLTNQYGVYIPALTGGSTNHGIISLTKSAFGVASADSMLKTTSFHATSGIRGSGLPTGKQAYLLMIDANGTFYKADSTGLWAGGGGGSSSPGGSDTYVQFNDGGSFGGDAGLTYNKTTNALKVAGSAGDITSWFNANSGASASTTSTNPGVFWYSGGAGSMYGAHIGYQGGYGTEFITGDATSFFFSRGGGNSASNFTVGMTLNGSNELIINNGVTDGGDYKLQVNGNGLISGTITSAAPTSGTAKPWKLGEVATVSPTSPNRTIRVEIDGTVYFIHAKTTND